MDMIQLKMDLLLVSALNSFATPYEKGIRNEFKFNRILLSNPKKFSHDKQKYYQLIQRQLELQKQIGD